MCCAAYDHNNTTSYSRQNSERLFASRSLRIFLTLGQFSSWMSEVASLAALSYCSCHRFKPCLFFLRVHCDSRFSLDLSACTTRSSDCPTQFVSMWKICTLGSRGKLKVQTGCHRLFNSKGGCFREIHCPQ